MTLGDKTLRVNSTYVSQTTVPTALTLKKTYTFVTDNSKGGDTVLFLPYMAGMYYLVDRAAPSRFDNILSGYIVSPQQEQEFIKSLRQKNVKVIVYDPESGPKMEKQKFREYNPVIHEYIMKNYTVIDKSQEGWLFLLRK